MRKTLTQLHNEFLDYSEFSRGISPKTLAAYKASFAVLMKRFPTLDASMLMPELMEEFFMWLQKRERIVGGQKRQGVKKSTIATYWLRLSKFFDWLKSRRYIEANPLKSSMLEFPSVRYDDRQYLGREDVQKILFAVQFRIPWKSNLARTRNLAIISMALHCGMRKGELLGLKLADVDLERNEVRVRSETSKSRAQRIVPLNSRVRADLEDYLRERRERRCATEYVWAAGRSDTRLTESGLTHAVRMIVRESGVRFHMHQFRHTFAVNFLHNSGHNSFKLQTLLGHRNIVSTAIYTRCLPPEMVRADVERLARLDNAL